MPVAFDARFVNDQYHGIGRHAYNLIESLTRLDPDQEYQVYYDPSRANSRFDFARLRVRDNVRLVATRIPILLPTEQLIWPRILNAARVRLFHSPYVTVPLLACRPVMTVHDLIFERFPHYMPQRGMRAFYRAMTAISLARSRLVLTVSESSARDIHQYYSVGHRKLRVIGNGVDPAFRADLPSSALEAVRARYRLPEKFALAVGAGRPHKNLGVLIDALARIEPTVLPAVVIAGSHDTRFPDEVSERMARLGVASRVVRPGAVREEDLPALYALASVLVFPSIVEGFGLPMLEAMACGTVVAASSAPSVREIAGDAAVFFDPHKADELAACVRGLMLDGDVRARQRERGLTHAAMFTWDRVATAALEGYATVLGSPN